ncbi:MAG: NUDIX domain-containing protein [Actinomycetaceae bacterium]|nr:NUDIX domain-containing protein [Actinomycetaceae bacterium]
MITENTSSEPTLTQSQVLTQAATGESGLADVVAVALVDPQNPTRILAARRAYPAQLRGKWELPGGKVRAGEDCRHALEREIKEELNCDIECGDAVVNPQREDGAWPILGGRRMFVWLGRPLTPVQCGPDHMEVAWREAANYRELEWLAPNLPIVEYVFKQISGGVPTGG